MNEELEYLVSAIRDRQLLTKQDAIYREHMANNCNALEELDASTEAVNNLQMCLRKKRQGSRLCIDTKIEALKCWEKIPKKLGKKGKWDKMSGREKS